MSETVRRSPGFPFSQATISLPLRVEEQEVSRFVVGLVLEISHSLTISVPSCKRNFDPIGRLEFDLDSHVDGDVVSFNVGGCRQVGERERRLSGAFLLAFAPARHDWKKSS